jgi:hypothetical protein
VLDTVLDLHPFASEKSDTKTFVEKMKENGSIAKESEFQIIYDEEENSEN